MSNIQSGLFIEGVVRSAYNRYFCARTTKTILPLPGGRVHHEYDLFDLGHTIGGVSKSPWATQQGNPNTGGRDRAFRELAHIAAWVGDERKVHILTDRQMALNIHRQYQGFPFSAPVEILHYCTESDAFTEVGTVGLMGA